MQASWVGQRHVVSGLGVVGVNGGGYAAGMDIRKPDDADDHDAWDRKGGARDTLALPLEGSPVTTTDSDSDLESLKRPGPVPDVLILR